MSERGASGSEFDRQSSGSPAARRSSSTELRFIAFRAGPNTFLVDIMAVRQIVPYSGSTRVPATPEFIEGVIVVRSEAIPVIDVHARLYPGHASQAREPLVLLTQTTGGVIGLKVTDVRRVVTLNSDALLPAPATIRGIRGDFLVAIAPHSDEVFLVLDVDGLLTSDEQRRLSASIRA